MAIPTGFEPVTPGLGIRCSILLSYGTVIPDLSPLLSGFSRRMKGVRKPTLAVPQSE